MSWIDGLLHQYLQQRLQLPSAKLAEIAADSAKYTADGQPLTVDQVQAADKAIIDFVLGRIVQQAVQPQGVDLLHASQAHADNPSEMVRPVAFLPVREANPPSEPTAAPAEGVAGEQVPGLGQ